MNRDTSFSFNEKETQEDFQNLNNPPVRKTPLKARKHRPKKPIRKPRIGSYETKSTSDYFRSTSTKEKPGIDDVQELLDIECGASCPELSVTTESTSKILLPSEKSEIKGAQELNTEIFASCLDLTMATESTSNNLFPKEKYGIEDIQEPLSTESGVSWPDLSIKTKSTSDNLSPKEKSGIAGAQVPLGTESGASCLYLSIGHADLNINRDIDEHYVPHEVYYDSCSSSSMADDDPFEETHPDGKSKQMMTSSQEHETLAKIVLPREMARNLVRFLKEKLEGNEPQDLRMHLLAAKNMIEDQLAINNDKYEGLAISVEGSRFGKDTSADFRKEIISTSLKLSRIVLDYEESLNTRFGKGTSSAKLLQEMMDTSLKLSNIVLEYEESFNPRFCKDTSTDFRKDIISTSLKLGRIVLDYEESLNTRFGKGTSSAKLLQEMIDTSLKLSNIVLEHEGSFNPRFGKDTSADFRKEIISTSLKLSRIVLDYEESLNTRFGKGTSSAKLIQEMMDTSLKLSNLVLEHEGSFNPIFGKGAKLIRELMDASLDLREIVLDYEESLDPIFDKGASASLLQEVIDTSLKMSDIVVDYLESVEPSLSRLREEDIGNAGSFPSFLANFLLMAALCAGFMFPALFVKYAPNEWWSKSVLNTSRCAFP